MSPSVLVIIVLPLKYSLPRHRSKISPLVALVGDKKPWCFAWHMNTELIVKLLMHRGWLKISKIVFEEGIWKTLDSGGKTGGTLRSPPK